MGSPRRFAPSLLLLCSSMLVSASAAAQAPSYDLIIRGGTIYDGSGKPPVVGDVAIKDDRIVAVGKVARSEEHTSELQLLMRISYAVFCLKKKKIKKSHDH